MINRWFLMMFDDLWWFMMICDDLWWFVMICDGLWSWWKSYCHWPICRISAVQANIWSPLNWQNDDSWKWSDWLVLSLYFQPYFAWCHVEWPILMEWVEATQSFIFGRCHQFLLDNNYLLNLGEWSLNISGHEQFMMFPLCSFFRAGKHPSYMGKVPIKSNLRLLFYLQITLEMKADKKMYSWVLIFPNTVVCQTPCSGSCKHSNSQLPVARLDTWDQWHVEWTLVFSELQYLKPVWTCLKYQWSNT